MRIPFIYTSQTPSLSTLNEFYFINKQEHPHYNQNNNTIKSLNCQKFKSNKSPSQQQKNNDRKYNIQQKPFTRCIFKWPKELGFSLNKKTQFFY